MTAPANNVNEELNEGLDEATREELLQIPYHVPKNTIQSQFLLKFIQIPKLDVRRLEKDSDKHVTHECVCCSTRFAFTWKGSSFDSTKAMRHLTNEKKCDRGFNEPFVQKHLKDSDEKKKRKIDATMLILKDYHGDQGVKKLKLEAAKSPPPAQQTMHAFLPETQLYGEKALCAQAHYFFYGKSFPPVDVFNDKYFKDMLKAMIPPGTEAARKPPLLKPENIPYYAEAEMELFKESLNKELAPMVEESKGVPFCQFVHDGVTITANKSKHQSLGCQFVNQKFKCNHVVALAFRKVADSKTNTVKQLAESVAHEITAFPFEELMSCSVQDAAAKSVAKAFGFEEETCDMHDGDKVSASAIGQLVRKDGRGNVVNPFVEGDVLVAKCNKIAKHFSSSNKNRVRHAEIIGNANQEGQNLPTTMIKQDQCGTRMSGFHGLLRSILRIKKSLQLCFLTRSHENPALEPIFSDADWKFAEEVEGVLSTSKDLVVFSQHERHFNAAYGAVVRNATCNLLRSDAVNVIDVDSWGSTARAPRKVVDVNAFSPAGRECRRRAILEHERRFFGHKGEDTMDSEGLTANLKLTKRELATLVLDKRTACNRKILPSKETWRLATDALEEFYVDFYMKRKAFERSKDQPDGDTEETEPVQSPQVSGNTMNVFSDDEDAESVISSEDDPENNRGITSTEQLNIDKNEATLEFKKVIRKWGAYVPDWKQLFPEQAFSHYEGENGNVICDPDPFTELMQIDMGVLMRRMEQHNSDNRNMFGFLPLMTRLSPCQLGALNAQSFVERMNSCGKLLVGEKRTRMKHDMIDKLVVLRMNRTFMEYCREKGNMAKIVIMALSETEQTAQSTNS